MGKTSNKAVIKYRAAHYDRLLLTMPKGRREIIQQAAAAAGLSQNAYVLEAVRLRLAMDGYTLDGEKIGQE